LDLLRKVLTAHLIRVPWPILETLQRVSIAPNESLRVSFGSLGLDLSDCTDSYHHYGLGKYFLKLYYRDLYRT
jgi:hypothetical protein